ncbi:MAG: T9SS C-terminal target domain-containing protein [Calditrichaeota bacterium]|nr:MAG: T9SS C-terminal target domain-containing protein [Calditrichota bacterium]MBL1204691.1 T9SS C-terminal target domain-containing protein [Calditrichota bacterium]NOG44519.1 T9SS type A sorting domain-containing protein [Calditrichota bacterium]
MLKIRIINIIIILALVASAISAQDEPAGFQKEVIPIQQDFIEEAVIEPDFSVDDSLNAEKELMVLEQDIAKTISANETVFPYDSTLNGNIQPPIVEGVAASVSWDGGAATNSWNDALNWSNDIVPTSSDDITLASGDDVHLIDGSNGVCNSLVVQSGASLTIGAKTLTVTGAVTVDAGGSLSLSGSLYLGGNWTNNGTFTPNSGSYVYLNGSGSQNISASNFFNLYLQNSATKTATGDLDIDGAFRIYNGVTFDPSTFDHSISDAFENDGTLSLGTGTITLDGTAWQSVYSNHSGNAPGVWNFNNLIISGNAGSVGVYDSISVNGDLTVNGGESLYLLHYNITNPSEGIVTGNGGTFTLEPDAGLLIRTQRTNGTGGADDNFPSSFNTVDLAFGSTSSVVYYQSNSNQIVRSLDGDGDQIQYGRILFRELNTGNFPTKQPDGNLDINGYFNIGANVTFDVTSNNYSINVDGSWYNYGTFTARGGTVVLDGNWQSITGNNSTTFNNLTFSGTDGKTLYRNTTVNSSCIISQSVSYVNLQSYILSGGGSSSITLQANARLYVRGSNNFPSFNSYSLDAASAVRYDLAGAQTVKTGISYGDLTLASGNTKSVDGSQPDLTVNGTLTIGGSTTFDFDNEAFVLNLYGDYTNSGTINATANPTTINLLGSNDVTFNAGGSTSGREVYNLTVNKSGGEAILGSYLKIDNDFNLTSGTFGMESYNRLIYIDGDWTKSGGTTFQHGTATVYFQGTSQTISGSGSDDFYNVDISGGTKTLGSAVDFNNNVTIQSDGVLDASASNYTIYVGGNFNNNNGGSFNSRNGTVTFDGSNNANFYIGSTDSLYNFTLSKSAGAYLHYDDNDLKVANDVLVQNGQLYPGYNNSTSQYTDLFVYGDYTNNGSFRADRADTVFFVGTTQAISASGTDDFNNISFNGSGTKTISSNVDVNRSLNISSGVTLAVSGSNILKIGRDFVNGGTFTCNSSTLEFDEYAGWNPIRLTTNGSDLYNLTLKAYNENYDLDLQDNLVVLNDLTVTKGDLDVTSNDYSITVGGSWTIESEGEFQQNSGTVTFDGAGSGTSETISSNSETFNNIVFNASGVTYSIQDQMAVNSDLTITNGGLHLNGNDLLMGNGSGDSLSVSDSLVVDAGSRLRLASGSVLVANSGGHIKVLGADGNPATVTNQGSGTYSFDILSGASIGAQYYTFESMDSDGIYVHDGATINSTNDFSNGTFTNGTSGGTFLRVDNNQTLSTISGTSFPSDPGGGASNVMKSLNQGSLTFVDAFGAFNGESNDDDTNALIAWTYSSVLRTWDGSESTDWDDPDNWTPNTVPTAVNRVTIPSGMPNNPLITSTGDSTFHLTIESGATLTLGDGSNAGKLYVTGDVNIAGTFVFSNAADTLYAEGNWSNTGTFTTNSQGAIILKGTSDQNIISGGTGAGKTFYDFSIEKTGGKAVLAEAVKIDNNFSIVDGTFDVGSGNYAVEVLGNWLKADTAAFTYQQGTVTMSGASSSITGAGLDDFYNLTINAAGISLARAIDVTNNFTINSSSALDVSASNYGITVYGNWTNSGTFTPQSGNVVFNGVNQTISGSSTTSFNNVTFENSGTKTVSSSFNVNGSISINSCTMDMNANSITGVGGGNLFSLGDAATLYVEGTANFPSGFESFSISVDTYVRYNFGGAQTVVGSDADGDIIEYGYLYLQNSGTKTANAAIDVNSSLYVANGVTFDLNSQDMNVGLYWDNNQGGTFTAGTGNTVTFDRDGTQYIYPNSSGDTFPNLVFGGTGAKILTDDITVSGDLTLNSGISYLNLQTYTLDGSGVSNTLNVSSDVTLYVRGADNFPTGFETVNLAINSIVRFDGNLAQNIRTQDSDSDQIQYGDIYFRYDTKTLDGDLNLRGRFYIYGSTVVDVDVANNYDINVGENWYNLGTTNLYNNTVTFDGSEDQLLYSYGTTAAKKFHHLIINKPVDSELRINTYDVQVDSNVTFTSGALYNTRTLTVNGNWNSSGSGTMTGTATVVFGGADQTITGLGSADFYDVTFGGSGTKTLGGPISVNDDLIISSGVTLDVSASNYALTILGDFTNSGTFTPQQGTVEFTGTATQYVYTNGTAAGKHFYNFKANKTTGSVYLRGHMQVDNAVLLEGSSTGYFRSDGYNITVTGSWLNSQALRYLSGDSRVTFNNTSKDTIQTGYTVSYPNQFYDFVADNSDTLIHLDNIRVDNSYDLRQGTVLLNGKEFQFGATNNSGDVFNISASNGNANFEVGTNGQLKVRRGNTVNVSSVGNTSTLKVVGTENNIAEVTYHGSSGYTFNVGTNGRLYARHYQFSYMDTAGIKIDGGQLAGAGADTTEDLSNGVFTNGVSGGRFLYINNNQDLQIDSVDFSTSLGAGENVKKPNDAGNILFFNASGIFSDSTYENDPFDRIAWSSVTTDNTWEGDVSSDWHTAGNWSSNSVPTSTDNVLIPNVTTDPLISNNDAACATMRIESGGLVQLGNSKDLTISGDLSIYGTLTSFGTDTITVAGDYENNGVLNPSTGTFIFNGVDQSLNSGGTSSTKRFNNLVITGNSSVVLSAQNLQVNKNITIDSGSSLDVSSSNRTVFVGGAWANSGTFTYRAGTVEFNSNSAQSVSGSGTNDFYNIEFSGTGTKTLSGSIDVNGSITINSGATVNGGNAIVTLEINFTNNGSFTGGTGTITFDRNGAQSISGNSTPTFNNIYFGGNNGKTLYVNINVTGELRVNNGVTSLNQQTYTIDGTGGSDTFTLQSAVRLYVRGADNFPSNFSTISLATDSYVRYDGNMTQTVRTKEADNDTISYGWLEISHQSENTGRRVLENSDVIVAGRLTVSAGDTLDVSANNYNITVGDRYYNYGYLLANGAGVQNTLTMNGSVTTQYLLAPGSGTGKEFYNLVINKTAGSCTFSGVEDIYVNNDLTIQSGTLNASGNRNIYVTGNWTNSGGTFTASNSKVHFDASTASKTIQSNNSSFYNVVFDGTSSSYSLIDKMTLTEDLTINATDTLDLNGQILDAGNGSDQVIVNGLLDVDAGAQLRLYNTASLTVASGGHINVVGTAGNIARVGRSSATGSYSFEVQSGAGISAQHYLFEYMNQNGIYVNGATIDLTNNFSNGTFSNGVTNGKFLNLNSNSQTLTGANKISDVQFPSNPGGTSYNVYATNCTGSYNFEDASGSFEGSAYEYDPDSKITWAYTTVTRTWAGTVSSDWHTANNWSPQAVPADSEKVIITTKSNLPTISSSDASCKTLTISSGSLTLNSGNNLTVSGNFEIASGASFTVNSNLDTVLLSGDWSNSGTFSHGNSTVIFQGNNVQNLSSGGTGSGKRFYNLLINKGATAQVSITDTDTRIEKDVSIISGSLVFGNHNVFTDGNFLNSSGLFDSGTGTLTFLGSETDTLQTNGSDLYNLTINTSGGGIYALDNVRILNDLLITAGTFYTNAKEISAGNGTSNQISIQGVLDVNTDAIVKVKGGSSGISVESGGELKAIGTNSSSLAEITRYGSSGYYPIIVNSGSTLNAKYAKFAYTNGSGVNVKSGATINTSNKLEGCVFENGTENSYLRISNNQVLGNVNSVIFNGGGSAPTNNINYDGTGSMTFNNYDGTLAGARYESDNGATTPGNVRWLFNESQNVSAGNTYTFNNAVEITVNTLGNLTSISVELIDSSYVNYNAYERYYNVSTVPVGATGYDLDIKAYYSDGTNNSNDEVPSGENDSAPYLWVDTGSQNLGPYNTSNNSSENWISYSNITSNISGSWYLSNDTEDQSLPVELASYNVVAAKEGIQIAWSSESELNNLKWIISRTNIDTENEIVVTEIDGMGTVSSQTNYSYVDTKIKPGVSYEYTLTSVSYSGVYQVEGKITVTALLPKKIELSQNYPNPFNGETTIQFTVPKSAEIEISIYNSLGQKVKTLANEKFDLGFYTLKWDGRNELGVTSASGIYFYVLQSKNAHIVKKLVYLK